MTLKIEIEVSEDNEATSFPWWCIVDPRQNFNTNDDGVHAVAHMITGPFFSRDSAESHLKNRRYAFGKNPHVYCMSGYWSSEYKNAISVAEKMEGRKMGEAQ